MNSVGFGELFDFFPLHLLKKRKYDSISERRNSERKKQSEKKELPFYL